VLKRPRNARPQACLVLSCFFRVHPLGGLFLAHAEAGLHCTVQSITPPWAGCSGLMHLNHLGALCGSYMYCPSSPGLDFHFNLPTPLPFASSCLANKIYSRKNTIRRPTTPNYSFTMPICRAWAEASVLCVNLELGHGAGTSPETETSAASSPLAARWTCINTMPRARTATRV